MDGILHMPGAGYARTFLIKKKQQASGSEKALLLRCVMLMPTAQNLRGAYGQHFGRVRTRSTVTNKVAPLYPNS